MSYKGFLNCNSRLSKEDQEFYDLKNKAAEYFRANGVPQRIEGVLNEMFYEKPDDINGFLANYFSRFATTAVIRRIIGKEVYDSRGQITVQAEVYCIIKNEEKRICSAAVASQSEAPDKSAPGSVNAVPNGSAQNRSVQTALQWIREQLCGMLEGFDPTNQTAVDKVLSDFFMARYLENQDSLNPVMEEEVQSEPVPEPPPAPAPPKDKKSRDKGKKRPSTGAPLPCPAPPVPVLPGGMAVGAVSLAVAKTAAILMDTPLYRHIAALRGQQDLQVPGPFAMPLPMVTLLSCGKASQGKLNLLEEVILVPTSGQTVKQIIAMGLELQREMRRILSAASNGTPVPVGLSVNGALQVGYDRPEQPLDLITEASGNLGLALGTELQLAVNCAAHELMDYPKGKYLVTAGTPMSPDELVDTYVSLTRKYTALTALIDPFRKEDVEQWERLSAMTGSACRLLADGACRQPCPSWMEERPSLPGVRGVILKHSDETTVTDLLRITGGQTSEETILGVCDGETCDDTLADVAVGLGVAFLKLGGLSGGERLTKYNRLICIEEELAQQGILGLRETQFSESGEEPHGQSQELESPAE